MILRGRGGGVVSELDPSICGRGRLIRIIYIGFYRRTMIQRQMTVWNLLNVFTKNDVNIVRASILIWCMCDMVRGKLFGAKLFYFHVTGKTASFSILKLSLHGLDITWKELCVHHDPFTHPPLPMTGSRRSIHRPIQYDLFSNDIRIQYK